MDSYTYMSDEGIEAVIANLPKKYPMELNKSDMENLIKALTFTYKQSARVNTYEWAGDFVSSIAKTLGIEFI